MDQSIIVAGILIFFARVLDVSLGTMRTIVTVQGRMTMAFILGIFETVIWITVVSAVISQITESPVLVVFYALGYACGNVVGILAERKIALGPVILRLIVEDEKKETMVTVFRDLFLDITTFTGTGTKGPVTEIYSVCRRRDLSSIVPKLREVDPNAFYVIEQARDVSKHLKPVTIPKTVRRPGFTKELAYHFFQRLLKPFNIPVAEWGSVFNRNRMRLH
ncbi:DUF2179 domain-containing protein [bacterium]|nr:DUF2179 domain-containing protein [bacterium]